MRSNAIVIGNDLGTIGIGAGQMSRVDAVRFAVEKAQETQPAKLDGAGAGLGRVLPVRRRPAGRDRGGREGDHPAGRLEARPGSDRGLRRAPASRWSSPAAATSATRASHPPWAGLPGPFEAERAAYHGRGSGGAGDRQAAQSPSASARASACALSTTSACSLATAVPAESYSRRLWARGVERLMPRRFASLLDTSNLPLTVQGHRPVRVTRSRKPRPEHGCKRLSPRESQFGFGRPWRGRARRRGRRPECGEAPDGRPVGRTRCVARRGTVVIDRAGHERGQGGLRGAGADRCLAATEGCRGPVVEPAVLRNSWRVRVPIVEVAEDDCGRLGRLGGTGGDVRRGHVLWPWLRGNRRDCRRDRDQAGKHCDGDHPSHASQHKPDVKRSATVQKRRARSSVAELRTFNPGVLGSNPSGPTQAATLAQDRANVPCGSSLLRVAHYRASAAATC